MSDKYRILSLDGGGIRGLITAVWLERLERELNKPLNKAFDLIAGTSTGGILACGVAYGVPASELINLYRLQGRRIFPAAASRLWSRLGRTAEQGMSAPKYSGEGLQKVLQEVFGDTCVRDLPAQAKLLLTTYNTDTRESFVIKSAHPSCQNLKLWEIAKATSAAPTYFPAHVLECGGQHMPLIDGGVVANNPTACAIAEASRINGAAPAGRRYDLEKFVVCSLGTGQNTRNISAEEATTWGALEWAVPIIDVLMDGASDATHYIAQQLLQDANYFRFQIKLTSAYDDLDRADATNLDALEHLAQHYLEKEGNAQIARLLPMLRD